MAYCQWSLLDAARDLQLLGLNLYRRCRCDNRLLARSIRDWFHHPLPANMSILVDSPGCATTIKDLHSPVEVVGRNCKHNSDSGHDHHSAQHSNEK